MSNIITHPPSSCCKSQRKDAIMARNRRVWQLLPGRFFEQSRTWWCSMPSVPGLAPLPMSPPHGPRSNQELNDATTLSRNESCPSSFINHLNKHSLTAIIH